MAIQRTETAYTFAELDADAQSRAIDAWRSRIAPWFWEDFNIEDDAEHWQARAAEAGVKIDTRAAQGRRRADGSQATELDVDYSLGSGFSDYVQFNAHVDLAVFMRSQRIAGKYRSLYNAAVAGDADALIREDVFGSRTYGARRRDGSAEIRITQYGYDDAQCERQDRQAETVQALLDVWYQDFCGEWCSALTADYEYRDSDDGIRDDIECNAGDDFLADGSLARLA